MKKTKLISMLLTLTLLVTLLAAVTVSAFAEPSFPPCWMVSGAIAAL